MNRVVHLSVLADRDVDAAYFWSAEHADLATAARFRARVFHDLEEIARHPWIGRERRDARSKLAGLRSKPLSDFEVFVLFYRVERDAIEVIRILHGARDIERVLNDEGDPDSVHEVSIASESAYSISRRTRWPIAS